MKTKVVFMLISMNIGGTEKALLNMVSRLVEDEYEITILMLEKSGGFLHHIPPHVKVLEVGEYDRVKNILNDPPQMTIRKLVKQRKVGQALHLSYITLLSKIRKDRSLIFRHAASQCIPLNEPYDVAVAYAGPMDFISYFVSRYIQAKKKIQWIHFDITKVGFDTRFAAKIYEHFDRIFVVSEEGKEKFINQFPSLKHKTERFNNIISPELVVQMSNEGKGFEDSFDGIRILTVGRLSHEKGQDLVIPVLAQLKQEGYHVRWYCIGEGSARQQYEQLIKEYSLEDDFMLLGAKANPYPFMKECDLYVQPSRYEGYCVALLEARSLNKPIISTDFNGAREQIIDGRTGFIVSFNIEDMHKAIKSWLVNEVLRKKFQAELQKQAVDESNEMQKFIQATR